MGGGRVDGDHDPAHGQRRCFGCVVPQAGAAWGERNWELEEAQAEIGRLTEAVKAQAIELAIVRGKSGWD
ncbi:hypothetical protein [Candidatus Poriferisodalis sp.]|uniref:hypothetical protein n=1 Tax=Candidatus Poriferisodalis sp. TaxID=3101277 RepID=UPI003B01CF41